MGAEDDLNACLVRLRRGDQSAARELVERLYPLVAKVVRAYLPRRLPAEEWEQEVFLRMFSRLDQYKASAPLEHWVSRIAVNTCLDALRQQARRRELRWADLDEREVEVVSQAVDVRSFRNVADNLAAREVVEKLLEHLAPEDQIVIRMLDMQSYSTKEIAATTGLSQPAIKVRAFRARRKLRRVLQRLLTADLR